MFHFGLVFSRNEGQEIWQRWLYFGYLLALIFFIISRTNYFIHDVFSYNWGVHTQASFFHHVFLLYYFIYIILFLLILANYYHQQKPSISKSQAGYILLAFLLMISLGSTGYLPAYGIAIYPVAYFSGLFFTIIVGWAIVRYRFMEFKFILQQGLVIFLSALTVLLIYNFLSANSWFVFYPTAQWSVFKFLLILILALSFNLLFKLYKKILEYLFQGQQRQNLISDQDKNFITEFSISDVSEKLHRELFYLFSMQKVEILLYDQNSDDYQSVYPQPGNTNISPQLLNRLVYYIKVNPHLILQSELEFIAQNSDWQLAKEVVVILGKYKYSGILPMYLGDHLVGLIFFLFPHEQLSTEQAKLMELLAQQAAPVYQQLLRYQCSIKKLLLWQQQNSNY